MFARAVGSARGSCWLPQRSGQAWSWACGVPLAAASGPRLGARRFSSVTPSAGVRMKAENAAPWRIHIAQHTKG